MRNRRDRLVGFSYDETTGIARFSMYVPGTACRDRKRATVQAESYDDAVRLWSAFRSRAAEGLTRPSPEAPTLRDFITDRNSGQSNWAHSLRRASLISMGAS